ncbi:MAG: SUMF1/EgtB/PvdO family nonheme iron enzyme [Bacteroidota bacterium]
MKNLTKVALTIFALSVILSSCGRRESGDVTGVLDRPDWRGINPYGMVYIRPGTVHIGNSDQDITGTFIQRNKAISISGFYMDETEISNNEYRQFVQYIKDSLAILAWDPSLVDGEGNILWDEVDDIDYNSQEIKDELFLPDTYAGRVQLNTNLFEYTYKTTDMRRAARDRAGNGLNDYVEEKTVNIYPDTMVWVRDFAYSYNEPMARNYFWHPAYDDYPVVGVNWHMANAFAYWRTDYWNRYNDIPTEEFRLPTEAEYEYAARGGREHAPYPWGGPYTRNAKGCLLANFKPGRGNYPEDGGQYTVPVDAYYPNDYGLYNMAGNVAEWTSSAFFENARSFVHDMNPDVRYDAKDSDPIAMKRKVIRGGSWKDISFYLQTGTPSYEYQDTTKSYVGFRNVVSFMGRSLSDF